MPRDVGTGIYTYPSGTPGIPNQTVFSARYNTFINDLANTLNQALPINMGGTGGDNAAEARDNLDAEMSMQVVTNYDSHAFEAGSFKSDPGATGAPESAHYYTGICHLNHAGQVYLEAYRYTPTAAAVPGPKYSRQKWTSWGPWVLEADNYVNVTGDVMTGDLIIDKTQPTLWLDKPTDASQCVVQSTRNGLNRWGLLLADSATDDFSIWRYNDAGTLIGPCLQLNRATGNMNLTGNMNATGPAQFNGDLTVAKTQPTINVTKPGDTSQCIIQSTRGAARRFAMILATGSDDDFELGRFNDSDVYQGSSIQINRGTGNMTLNGAVIGITGNTTNTGTFTATGHVSLASTMRVNGDVGFNCVAGSNPGFSGGTTGVGIDANGELFASCATTPCYLNTNAVGVLLSCQKSSAFVGNISVTGSATAFNTSSDERLKEDLKSFDAGHVVDDTNVYDFKWKTTGERSYGIIAQQAQDVYPAAVFHDEKTDWWGIDYSKYVPVLLQELKALRARVAQLEGRTEAGAQPA